MSRRRGEFEHRTSIFEGAFRAWSHLGGLEPLDLETKPASELDPIAHPLVNDVRLAIQKEKDRRKANKSETDDDSADKPVTANGREYPYEPLPRSGLVHPFVQAILSPWLGPDADQDAIQLGLTTLRTWWQHRRKGESGSAVVALGTEKMQGVVEGYTRHFFNLAHCLVVNDKEQPPRTLQAKMRDLEKVNTKKNKKRGREDDGDGDQQVKMAAMTFNNNVMSMGDGGELLDRLQASQQRLLAAQGGISSLFPYNNNIRNNNNDNTVAHLEMKGQCIPGKLDLPSLVRKVNSAATQLAHRGLASAPRPNFTVDPSNYGDPNLTPLVLLSSSGDVQFLMTVDGITCAHCVKIVETVLKGCPGSTGSPIDGLLDVAADQQLNAILVKISGIDQARRIAHQAVRNLSMVGYTARAKSVNIQKLGYQGNDNDGNDVMTLQNIYKVFESVPNIDPVIGNVLQWDVECKCPENDVMRTDCPRHQQMSSSIFEAFDKAKSLISELVTGCGKKYGMPCTAGVHCFCVDLSNSNNTNAQQQQNDTVQDQSYHISLGSVEDTQPVRDSMGRSTRLSMRMSLGGLLGQHSLTSNTTFGRAMSGLSALSIDWENMDDFDVNLDHSEGINNDIVNLHKDQREKGVDNSRKDSEQPIKEEEEEEEYGPIQRVGPRTARRSSLRNPTINNANANVNVSFDT